MSRATDKLRLPLLAVERLDALYAKLPKIACKGLCHESCGPIIMSEFEHNRIAKAAGSIPVQRAAECPMLMADKRCSVYEVRPLVCRMWGVAKRMPCVFGCEPERLIGGLEEDAIFAEYKAADGKAVMFSGAPEQFRKIEAQIEEESK